MTGVTKKLMSFGLAASACLILSYFSYGYTVLELFPFEFKEELQGWKEHKLKGSVEYWIDYDHLGGFVHAKSQNTCSALYRWIKIDLKNQPLLSWRWKALRFPQQQPQSRKDDFAARVYVIFPGISFGTSEFLEYIWDQAAPVDTVETHPQASNVRRIIVQTGGADPLEWHYVKRNLCEDYTKAFGHKPKRKAGILAFMSDSNDTQDEAEAFFDEIKVEYIK